MIGTIFDVKELGVHDGPGLRTTVFMKGCPLRCIWCHNPEGLSMGRQLSVRENACVHCGACFRPCNHPDCKPFGRCLHICPKGLVTVAGEEVTPEQLAGRLLRNKPFWGERGGVTFSGGEPLLQADFVKEVIDLLGEDVSVAIETSGCVQEAVFASVIARMNLVYMDVKLADSEAHKRFTGVTNEKILRNLEVLRASGVPCVIRTPLIPGITDTRENLEAIEKLVGDLPWEKLPYNNMAGAKYPFFGMEYPYDKYMGKTQ